jgi:hypothetical protein
MLHSTAGKRLSCYALAIDIEALLNLAWHHAL